MELWRGLLLGSVAALVVALPAAWRAEAALLPTWLALWGATALVLGPVTGALRLLGGVPRGLRVLASGLGLAVPVLVLFAGALQRGTHHRPLGAVTFSLIGLCLVAGAVAVMARVEPLRRSEPRRRRLVAVGLADLSVLFVAALAALALRHPALRAGVLDAVLACGAVALGGRLRWPAGSDRVVRVLGPTLWAVVVASAALASHAVPAPQSAGPVLFGVGAWLAG
jgi:hypothetical protein